MAWRRMLCAKPPADGAADAGGADRRYPAYTNALCVCAGRRLCVCVCMHVCVWVGVWVCVRGQEEEGRHSATPYTATPYT